MAFTATGGRRRHRDLAAQLGISRSGVTHIVDRLEGAGLAKILAFVAAHEPETWGDRAKEWNATHSTDLVTADALRKRYRRADARRTARARD